MYNPILAEAIVKALHAERLAEAEAARRAAKVARRRRRHTSGSDYTPHPTPALA